MKLSTRNERQEIFLKLKFEIRSGLNLYECVHVTTDGAEAAAGPLSVADQQVKYVAANTVFYHRCIRH
jgi:hypothetical protein